MKNKSISEIANVIRGDWTEINYQALAYVSAMHLNFKEFKVCGSDGKHVFSQIVERGGREIVARFLSNASGWKGDVAHEVKEELNRRLK